MSGVIYASFCSIDENDVTSSFSFLESQNIFSSVRSHAIFVHRYVHKSLKSYYGNIAVLPTDISSDVLSYIKCSSLCSVKFFRVMQWEDLDWLCEKWFLTRLSLLDDTPMYILPVSSPSGYRYVCKNREVLDYGQELAQEYVKIWNDESLQINGLMEIMEKWANYLESKISLQLEIMV